MLITFITPALLVAAMWGFIPIMEKQLLSYISAKTLLVIFGLFTGIMSIFLGLYYYKDIYKDFNNKELIEKVSFKMLFIMVFFYILASLIYYILLKDNKSHVVVALTYTTPLFVALFSYLLSKEEITKTSIFGIILIVLGSIIVSK